MRPGRIVALVIGCIAALIGMGLLLGALGLGLVYATQRDDDGYFTSDTVRIESPTAAIRSERIDLGSDDRPERWPFGDGDLATVRLRATAPEDEEVFVGIAHTDDVDAYIGDDPPRRAARDPMGRRRRPLPTRGIGRRRATPARRPGHLGGEHRRRW